jgi:hypothetical protein
MIPDGKPLRKIVKITKEPFGAHGGKITLLQLECGDIVPHIGRVFQVGQRTECPACKELLAARQN